jgi:hypothetical protein
VLSFDAHSMNGLCTACKQPVEVLDFRLGEGIVVVRCTACGKQQRLSLSEASGTDVASPAKEPVAPVAGLARPPVAKPAAASPALAPSGLAIEPRFEPPEGFCRKCVAPRAAGSKSCPSCGLVFANAPSFRLEPSVALMAAFRALAARWGEAKEHVRFLHQAQAGGELAMAGRLYRIRLAQAPTDAVARASLEATVKMASAPVNVASIKKTKAQEAVPGRRRKLIMVAITFFGPSLLFALFKFFGGGH